MSVPPQYFQSIIALELAITGALLWQIRYFEHEDAVGDHGHRSLPRPLVRLMVAVVLAGTLLGSLLGILHGAGKGVAISVGVGLVLSLLPILLRVLPPLPGSVRTKGRDARYAVTVIGLLVYVVIAGAFIALLSV